MKPQSKTELSQLLSAYVDGELDEQQARSVEELLSQNAEAWRELQELKALKGLIASKRRIPPSLGFWTRLSVELELRKKEEENLLPFPRRYVPLVATGTAVIVLALGILLYQQRALVVDYVSKQSELVQKAVESNVLKGSLMPLFSHVDKNEALRFAMFGTMPLDAKAETQLRVNEDSARGYTIDVNKKSAGTIPVVTVKDFVDEVKPTQGQLEVIDSLLDLGRKKIESSVLVAEDKALAVDPQLSRLNRVMLSGIAACLEPKQQARFERFLQVRRAPYTLAGKPRSPESSASILHTMRMPSQPQRFLVVTPETVLVSGVSIDMDSLRREFLQVQTGRERVVVNMNGLIRRIAEREIASRPHVNVSVPHLRFSGDSDFFSIQIGTGWEGKPDIPRDMWVKPRAPRQVGSVGRNRGQAFEFEFNATDTSFEFNLDLDSLMLRMSKDGPAGAFEFFKGDPRLRNRVFKFDGVLPPGYDGAPLAKKRSRSKLDSLMLEMEKREMMRDHKQKESEQND